MNFGYLAKFGRNRRKIYDSLLPRRQYHFEFNIYITAHFTTGKIQLYPCGTQIEDKSPNYWHLLIVPRVIYLMTLALSLYSRLI
jgi:hypothetical protein